MRALVAFLTVLSLVPLAAARADVSGTLVHGLVDDSVIPAYRRFEQATGRLSEALDRACASGELDNGPVRTAFAEAWLAWAGARHVAKGPVTYFDRLFRIEFWPDTRNRISRGLSELRAEGGTPEIAAAVVAVQGFPALERLIYAGEGASDCFIARPIADNLHTIAAEILTDWTEGDSPFRTVLVQPGTGAGVYFTYAESLAALMTGAISSLEGVLRLRLKRPLGDGLGKPRPRRAEAWRSGLSMDLIRADLAAVADFYGGDGRGLDEALRETGEIELADLMTKAFRLTRETATKIYLPLAEAVTDPAAVKDLDELVIQVSALKALMVQRVGPALGISAGFNALDGD